MSSSWSGENHSLCVCVCLPYCSKGHVDLHCPTGLDSTVATVSHYISPQVVCVVMCMPLPVHLQLLIYVLVYASASSEQISQAESFVTIHPHLPLFQRIISDLRSFFYTVIPLSGCGEKRGSMEKAVNGWGAVHWLVSHRCRDSR